MPNDIEAAILGEVLAEMARQRVTRQTIAAATDSDPASVGRWLSGKASPRLEWVIRVADTLGVTVESLVSRAAKDAA